MKNEMRAALFDGSLRFVDNYLVPRLKNGWALIRVHVAGICKTDMELMKGYMGFKGVLGHEFVGVVEKCDDAQWIGKRVAGEINAACGVCEWCKKGLGRHCPNRTVLGILNHDGCMADYCILPTKNLIEIPKDISNDRAVLIEPLSAACEILEQVKLNGSERAVILGDGRLGILCSWVLSTVLSDVTLVGHHQEKLTMAKCPACRQAGRNIKTTVGEVKPGVDIVVEATGSGSGMTKAMSLCRPRGTIVLKSTCAYQGELNLAPVVINEQTIVGSRCGQFKDGLLMLQKYKDMPLERLLSARYPIEKVADAFKRATASDAIKVLLEFVKI